jgi:dihydrofolate reductase/thymidylate synthase
MGGIVLMGRKTWDSLPAKVRPLSGRTSIVLSGGGEKEGRVSSDEHWCRSWDQVATTVATVQAEQPERQRVYLVGGERVLREGLERGLVDSVSLTVVRQAFDADVFFPGCLVDSAETRLATAAGAAFVREGAFVHHAKPIPFDIGMYRLVDPTSVPSEHPEQQYLRLAREVLRTGVRRGDRTGTGTLSVFGRQMRFSLRDGTLPLLTTKRVFWRGVAEELLWFVRGSTNAKLLQDKKVRIWDGNSSREYLDSIGLTNREVGDLGPVYGFQWRHWGAEYTDMHANYEGKGIDQLQRCIDTIRTNPTDRRIIMSAWNPTAMPDMALPPCHMFCQFYVANGELSCSMYQRSADMGLGVPFNIASSALLTHMIAHVTGLAPGEFVHTIGDAHVYANHVEALQVQLQREPRPFPTLTIKRTVDKIDDFVYEDFAVEGYEPHGNIKMQMAV